MILHVIHSSGVTFCCRVLPVGGVVCVVKAEGDDIVVFDVDWGKPVRNGFPPLLGSDRNQSRSTASSSGTHETFFIGISRLLLIAVSSPVTLQIVGEPRVLANVVLL